VSDCIDLESRANVNWYGGNQQRWQYYPIQKLTHKHNAYVTKEEFNQAIAERYWLNSHGIFFHVDSDAPLFIDQNNEHPGFMCLQVKRTLPYDIHHSRFDFTYHIGIGLNARDAHMRAVGGFLGKPTGHPDEAMVREPIWSTWAKYKVNVSDAVVREFAKEILDNGFKGQFELDDDWEICYGSLTFRQSKFPNIKKLTDDLRASGFKRITLWIHPFINKDCTQWYNEAKDKGYLVADHNGNLDTQWWNSEKGQAAYVDFTKPDAAEWFSKRLRDLATSSGIDSYKFDAGETSWTPPDPVLNGIGKEHPSKITQDYVKTVAKFGSLVEVRAGQNTQFLPIFVRMIDKDTEWTLQNGLPTLITTLLQVISH
jgi:myogenesis-regulating glycosidase